MCIRESISRKFPRMVLQVCSVIHHLWKKVHLTSVPPESKTALTSCGCSSTEEGLVTSSSRVRITESTEDSQPTFEAAELNSIDFIPREYFVIW